MVVTKGLHGIIRLQKAGEPKSFRFARALVANHARLDERRVFGEEFAQQVVRDFVAEIAHEQAHIVWCTSEQQPNPMKKSDIVKQKQIDGQM